MMMKTFLPFVLLVAASSVSKAAISEPLTDGEIAKALITLDDGEIEAARMAQTRSHNDDVKNYASMMSTAHRENAMATKKLAKDDKFDARESAVSKSIKADAKAETQKLAKAGGSFDKDYVESQVKMHQKALQTIDQTLLPAAKNGDLHSHLEATRTTVEEHLEHAKSLEQKIH